MSKNFTPNEFILHDTYAEIVINSRKYGVKKIKIDLEDVDKCKNTCRWTLIYTSHYLNVPYVIGGTIGQCLHRFIIKAKKGTYVDHINGDTFDNRKSNLRICTKHQNCINKGMDRRNKTGVTGVHKTGPSKWISIIRYNKRNKHLGTFYNFEDAVKARKEAEIKYFGTYRRVS